MYIFTDIWKVYIMAPFKCSVCPLKFSNDGRYNRHRDLHATGFSCSKCNVPFVERKNLNVHIRKNRCPKPIVKRTYKCKGHCDKMFASGTKLSQHMAIAKGTFKCHICAKTFDRKARLDTHQNKCREPLPSVSSDDGQFSVDFITSPSHPRADHPSTPNVPKALCKLQCTSDSSDNSKSLPSSVNESSPTLGLDESNNSELALELEESSYSESASELDESNNSNVFPTGSASNDSTSTSKMCSSPTPVIPPSSLGKVSKSCKKSLVFPTESASNAGKSTQPPVRRSTRVPNSAAKLRALCLSPIKCDNEGKLYKFLDPIKKYGVKSHEDIAEGSFVLSYHGERFTKAGGLAKEKELEEKGEIASYLMFFQDKAINADPHNDNSFGGLLNHSRKAPNLGWSTKFYDGTWYVAFYALTKIPAHTELLWDYGEERKDIIDANPWLKE